MVYLQFAFVASSNYVYYIMYFLNVLQTLKAGRSNNDMLCKSCTSGNWAWIGITVDDWANGKSHGL